MGRAEPAASRASTAKGRATRQAFRQAGREVFATRGFFNSKLSDIAAAAGKSAGSFYNYYDSKEALLADLASDFNDELHRRVAEPYRAGMTADAALRTAIQAFWDTYQERMPEVAALFQAAMHDETFAQTWRTIRGDGIRTISRGIRQAQEQGYCPGLHPDLAASALSSMIEHFCYVWQAQGGDPHVSGFSGEHAVETLWQLWSHALLWTDGADVRQAGPRPLTQPQGVTRRRP